MIQLLKVICYYWQMHSKIFAKSVIYTNIKIYELKPAHFVSARRLARQASLKRAAVELKLLTDFVISTVCSYHVT